MKFFTKFIRVITIAPVMAVILLLVLFCAAPQYGITRCQFFFSLLFLAVMPVLAYPLQPYIKPFKNQGRTGQRNLAIIFSVIGYLCGLAYSLLLAPNKVLSIVYLTYLLSGVIIALFTRFTPLKASGHACGIVGPATVIICYVSWWGLLLLIPYTLTFFSSVRMKRHSVTEYLIGSLVPIASLALASLIIR